MKVFYGKKSKKLQSGVAKTCWAAIPNLYDSFFLVLCRLLPFLPFLGHALLYATIISFFYKLDNPKGWVGYGEARGSIAAFLFVYENGIKALPTKLRKVGGPSLAQQDLPEIGPSFGADSLVLPMSDDNPKLARSKLGSYYERFPDGTNTLFGKGRGASVQLKDLKVYHGVYEAGEYIPFTDAEPFALY